MYGTQELRSKGVYAVPAKRQFEFRVDKVPSVHLVGHRDWNTHHQIPQFLAHFWTKPCKWISGMGFIIGYENMGETTRSGTISGFKLHRLRSHNQ